MYKSKYYRAPKPQTNPNKNSRPKPEWTTDFSDPDKYKLSEAEMIQRKAALQSKNRQSAKHTLEQRRKKLEMGIIDEDTRKVYETALQSKKIDLNPPIRKNLSQMIQYQREKRDGQVQRHHGQESSEEDEFEKQIKQTQQFIKKLQKAKKQTKIEKAVDILLEQNKSTHFGPTKSKNIIESYDQTDSINQSHEDALSNIEQTIKFMQEKLFGNKTHQEKKEEQSMISPIPASKQQFKVYNLEEEDDHETSKNQFLENTPLQQQTLELSHLNMDNHEEEQEDDECMQTIRRMREMIESKENMYNYDNVEHDKKMNSMKYSESQPEIDFNLTMNEEEQEFKNKYLSKQPKHEIKSQYGFDYEAVKKNLFEQVDKLQNFSFDKQQSDHLQPRKQEPPIPHHFREEPRFIEQPEIVNMKKPKKNSDLEELKNMVSTTKTKLQSIKVEDTGSNSNNMMGFDFRGSINIKKNVIRK